MRRLAAALLIVGVWFGCASREAHPAQPAAREESSSAEQLRRDLAAIFTAPAIDHALWGVSFRSLNTRETICSYNASRFLLPLPTRSSSPRRLPPSAWAGITGSRPGCAPAAPSTQAARSLAI